MTCAWTPGWFLPDVSKNTRWIIYLCGTYSNFRSYTACQFSGIKPTDGKKDLGDPFAAGGCWSSALNAACKKLESMNEKVEDWGDFVNRYTSHSSRHSSPERELDYGDVRLTPSPILSLFNTAEKQFCRRDNIDQCIAYLNQVCSFAWFLYSTGLHVYCYRSTSFSNDCFYWTYLQALRMILNSSVVNR